LNDNNRKSDDNALNYKKSEDKSRTVFCSNCGSQLSLGTEKFCPHCGYDLNKGGRDETLKTQYDRLSEDWRHFNNLLWGIPSVAVSILAGIIVAAYQPSLAGWPRIALLVAGCLFLFAITYEVVKKRLLMNVVSNRLARLQGPRPLGLGLGKDDEKTKEKVCNESREDEKKESYLRKAANAFKFWCKAERG
jgi:hypothetical protein